MANNERKRTMVYSNVKKKADSKSASSKNRNIGLDDDNIIGLASFSEKNNVSKKAKVKKEVKKSKNDNNVEENKKTKKMVSKKDEIFNKNQEIIKQKKKAIICKFSIILLFIILIIGGITYFLLSPIFNVKTIEVINNNTITSEQIVNLSGIQLNNNTFKFSKKDVKSKILSNSYIEDAEISRSIFEGKVKIEVKERIPTIMLDYGNSYVYINNQGYILEISTVKLNSPVIKGYVTPLEDVKPGNRLCKDDLLRLETVLRIMESAENNELDKLITYIDIKDRKNFVIGMESEEKVIYLGKCSDLSTQMLYIKKMIEKEAGIEGEFFVDMDLNTGKPVFREKV